jgi:hypothetical protein
VNAYIFKGYALHLIFRENFFFENGLKNKSHRHLEFDKSEILSSSIM